MTELGDSLERMSFMQLLLLFGFVTCYVLALGGLFGSHGAAARRRAGAAAGGGLRRADRSVGARRACWWSSWSPGWALFVMLSWLLARLLAPAPCRSRWTRWPKRRPTPPRRRRSRSATAMHAARCRSWARAARARRASLAASGGVLETQPEVVAAGAVASAQQPQRPRRRRPPARRSGRPPGRGRARTPSCRACSAAPRRRGAWWSGWPGRRGSCTRRASTSARAAVRRSTAVAASKLSSGRRCCRARSCRSSCRCGWLVRARCERGITRRQPFSVVDASSATHTVQVASGRIGQ